MEYKYSTVVDPSAYETEGLCEGIPLRVHHYQVLEDLGSIKAQEDWRKYVAPTGFVKGLLGPEYNVASVMFPEIKPERLEVLAYFNEFVGLHDDVVEEVQQDLGDAQNDEARDMCSDAARGHLGKPGERDTTGRKRMLSAVAEKMYSLDPGPASVALRLWAEWFNEGSGRRNHTQFQTLDEYLTYRVLDIGEKLTTGMTIFGMGLTIPEHEMPLLSQLCRPAWVSIGLTNDIFSWDKEKKAADLAGESHISNAIWVVMRQHGIGFVESVELCRTEIKQNVARFVSTVRETTDRTDISEGLKIFVESSQYMVSGNVAWSQGTPRYNPTARYNARQLDWMVHGTPDSVGVEKVGNFPEKSLHVISSQVSFRMTA